MRCKFELDNDSDKVFNVENELINSFDVAKAKAVSIFLKKSYIKKTISISTYHIDNLKLGDIIKIDDELYIVEKIQEKISQGQITLEIGGYRYVV